MCPARSSWRGPRDADWVTDPDPLTRLRSTGTIRSRCACILAGVRAGESRHFVVARDRLQAAAELVAAVTRRRYPDLAVPYHSRWRHFEAAGIDRHGPLRRRLIEECGGDPVAAARALVDLAVVSVLLDAGAGARWSYREADSGVTAGRSEGLALASLAGFRAGVFSSDGAQPLRVDARALLGLEEGRLADLFQVSDDNPLVGLAGRARLLNTLGRALADHPDLFGPQGRPGTLLDTLPRDSRVSASDILQALLAGLSSIWPSGQSLAGSSLGDCWRHRLATPAGYAGIDAGWVPFHKLSQWLTYSLLEPFEWAGFAVTGLDALTGLPEYRNGGLLLDTGVLALKDPAAVSVAHAVGSELVVEWRALTVALIDEIAVQVRAALQLPLLPLAAVLEGGTWAAGRELAMARRGGEPPLAILSDGTVF